MLYNNPLDNFTPNVVNQNLPVPGNLQTLLNQATQNPRGFEQMMRQNYPDAYRKAIQIRNGPNPQQTVMQMLQSRGINPGILQMLGIR